MDEKCYVDGCPGTAKFSCICDDKLQVCQEHIAEHIRGLSYHEIYTSKRAQSLSQQRANQAIFSLSNLNSKALSEGKDMFKELCEKLCNIVDELSKRQQSLVDLSTSDYSRDVEEKIQELENVNIAFRNKSDFKKLLDKFMSPGADTFDSSSLEEFKKDFRGIIQSLDKSNEILHFVAATHKDEQVLRMQLESRIGRLEQGCGKIENLDQRIQRAEIEIESHLKIIEDARKNMDKGDVKIEAADKRFKERADELQKQGRNQMNQFQALENGIRKSAEDNMNALNHKYKKINKKVTGILQVKDGGFRQMLDKFFEEFDNRRIAIEAEEMEKKIYEDIKRREQEEKERKRKDEEENKRIQDLERIKNYLKNIENIDFKQKIGYFHPIVIHKVGYSLKDCYKRCREILVSNDGKYLFFCKFD